MDVEAALNILSPLLSIAISFATVIVALRLTKFFRGGIFMNVWRTLYFVPLFIGLAEIGHLLDFYILCTLFSLGASLTFFYSLNQFYKTWIQLNNKTLHARREN